MSEFDQKKQKNLSGRVKLRKIHYTGIIPRKFILTAIAAPLVIGWLIRQGEILGWYDSSSGLILMAFSLMLIALALIGCNVIIINGINGELRASEERLQLALTAANQGIWDLDLKTKVLTWDERCKKIFGLTADFPVTYEWHLDALHPDDRERVVEAAAIALLDHTQFNEEYRTFHPDGTMRWIRARGSGYYDESGKPERMLGTVLDISERQAALRDRQQAEASLVETNNILQAVINGTDDVIFVKNLQGRYVLANQAAARWLKTTVEAMLGKDDLDLFPAEVAASIQTAEQQVIARKEFISYEEQLLKQDDMRSLLSTKYPWCNDQGEVIGIIGISRDITYLKQAEVALRESESRFQRLAANVPGVIYQYANHPDGTSEFTYISSRSQDIYEYEPEVLLEDFSPVWQMIHPDDQERVSAANSLSAERLEPFNIEFRLLPTSGKLKWVQAISMPERQSNGDTIWDGIVIEITDRKQAQLNEQFLKELDLRLRQLSDAKAMVWEAVSSIGEYLNVDRCFWHEIDWENRLAIIERNWRRGDVADLAGTYHLENFFTAEQFARLAAGQPLIVPDVTTHPETAPYAQSYQPVTVAAFVATPCIQLGRWVANLSINCTTVRNWRDDEVNLLQETVARLWSIIEQTRALQALRASEYQYRTLFEIIDQGFCVCQMLFDEHGEPNDYRFLEVNSVFGQMTGLEQATGKTARELVPNLEDFWFQTYGRVVRTGEPARFENQSQAMNRWFDVSAFRFDEAQNHKFAVLFTNITARKQAEADLQQRNQYIQILYEISRDLLSTYQPLTLVDALFAKLKPLIGLDIYFNYIVDEQQQKLHLAFSGGISAETAKAIEWLEIGQAICGTVAQQRCQIVQPNLQQSTDPKTELVRNLGLTAYSCQPLISQGKLFGTLGFGSLTRTEFTPAETQLFQAICDRIAIALERSELVSSLQHQTAELTKANRLKDEFLAALSHELRTPLNPILGWTKLLQAQKLPPAKTQDAFSTIERNVKQQIALVDDLLDISRVVQGQFQLTSQPVDLVPIINAARDSMHFAAIAKSITLEFRYPFESIGQVMGDDLRLQQVFWNLLSNAIKFTPDGGRVEVWLEKVQNTAKISIIDTGIGIDLEFLPHVFDRFRQADGSSTRQYGGLGLGLSLVKHLVELHGGTVTAASLGEDKGATFTVNLPLLKESALSNFSTASDSQQPPTDLSSSFIAEPLTGIRILVIDDEPDNLDLISFFLTQEGAIVTTVNSATQILSIISQDPPDILISDIGMPEMDGYELLQQIRALPSQQDNPVKAIALSAFARPEDQEKAIAAGFQVYLSKPINLNDLSTAIAAQVNSIA